MFFLNPDPAQIANIKAMQKARLAQLNELTSWNAEDFDAAYSCYLIWYPEKNEWAATGEGLTELVTNPRVPQTKLELIAKAFRKLLRNRAYTWNREN
ncbi:hypothetical protein GO755_10590 [Spirosoma sp. HMF4905]|uniref:Uncharacterized protein n=1 Tax=Spirosoma arboris TaxID=2682092 RepID=A0A7K1S9N7_9BACT|nr:hypothetical protein [Spirosoma arboris]MVM30481.1 hypothetical protein [Spirosoma arboris]